jgi:hypothetical protein
MLHSKFCFNQFSIWISRFQKKKFYFLVLYSLIIIFQTNFYNNHYQQIIIRALIGLSNVF